MPTPVTLRCLATGAAASLALLAAFASPPATAHPAVAHGASAPVERTTAMKPLNPQPLPPRHGSIGTSTPK